MRQPSIALLGFAAITIGLAATGLAAQSPTHSAKTNLGGYTVEQYDTIDVHWTTPVLVNAVGKPVKMSSPLYDLTAPTIHMKLSKVGAPPRYKATEAIATGGVHVIARNPDAHRTTTLTSDRADYHATANPADKGKLVLTGHVHSVTEDPALVEPLIQDSERATITFVDADTTDIEMENGSISGTPREPTPKPATKATPKSQPPAHP